MTRIHRSGTYTINGSFDEVFTVLSDPERVARCIPDSVEIVDRRDSEVDVTVKIGTPVVSTRLHLELTLLSADPETGKIHYRGTGSGPRSHVSFRGTFEIEGSSSETRVDWEGALQVHGMLVAMGEHIGRYEPILSEKITAAIENVQSSVIVHE